ncbi:hypothetical protein [Candidatus Avelusimicrobium fimicolum]|jgi:flagellar basal body-associated protein FliL|uniref:glycogen-binding domain-containing protein n=1 Tax=Candidatus Avelusimicrobium fimicolum TaxID=3416216 RepID=UPI003D111CBC
MENENLDLDIKPAGNKDLWLFLIIIDIIFLCVFGYFVYKHFSARVFDAPANAPSAEQAEVVQTPELPKESEPVLVEENKPVEEKVPAAAPVEIPVTAVIEQEEKKAEPSKAAPAPETKQETKESVTVNPSKSSKYRRVTFRWYGEGNKVAIVSGFTMAKPQALKKRNGYWETTLSIAPGTYKFLYVVDGQNTLDPYSQEKDGRSLLIVK